MVIDTCDIKKILPQRFPFLLIDRVIEFEEKKRIVALKNVTVDEYYVPGHFPSKPLMPGVLIIEAMAQAAIIYFAKSYPRQVHKNSIYYLSRVEAKFLLPVLPGDQLKIEVKPLKIISNMGIVSAEAFVNAKLAAKATLGFSSKKDE